MTAEPKNRKCVEAGQSRHTTSSNDAVVRTPKTLPDIKPFPISRHASCNSVRSDVFRSLPCPPSPPRLVFRRAGRHPSRRTNTTDNMSLHRKGRSEGGRRSCTHQPDIRIAWTSKQQLDSRSTRCSWAYTNHRRRPPRGTNSLHAVVLPNANGTNGHPSPQRSVGGWQALLHAPARHQNCMDIETATR